MAITLIGEVVNSADTITGYNAGNISGDDDFVEGTGAIGLKVSATTSEMYTTSLGATAPYNFSAAGTEFGYHIIMWFNTKTPVQTTNFAGIRIVVGDGTSRAHWYVLPTGFYKGGFITCVVSTQRNFDVIAAGAWTLAGNPAQLTNVTQMGGVMEAITSIMGNFNNFQLDQFTIGEGVRADGGTVGTPNNFETARAADEDGSLWGWWSSKNGQIVGKGKLRIGPETGTATSVFDSLAESVVFGEERVSRGFYEIEMRGGGTDVTWELISLSSATTGTNARWNIFVSSSCNSFSDTNGVWLRGDQIRLTDRCHLTGTTIINTNKFFQSGSTFDGVTILDANTVAGEAFVIADDIGLIVDSVFEYSNGHAIEIPPSVITPVTYSLDGNQFLNYTADDTSGSAIFNNSGGPVLINISGGGSTPTIRNGFGSSTDVQNPVSLTITNIVSGSEVRILSSSTAFPPIELAGTEESSTSFTYNYQFTAGQFVDIVVLDLEHKYFRLANIELTSANQSIPIQQEIDRVYRNP